jgi:LPS export ABC transporter protein LptC
MLAITTVVASIVVSCKNKIGEAERLDLSKTPTQQTFDMFAVQTENGAVEMRLEAPLMEHYDTDSASFDTFPKGISVFGYTKEGLLESIILADDARHIVPKDRNKDETWEAFGNVILHNVIEQETMETDTIYWDQAKKEVYTDCYVKIYSRQGFLQGFGMRSDDHVRNSILYRPFDGYGVVVQDSTAVIIDSVNFIGPFPKK